ncbi:GNAT family N-acetyltransferase [Phycicoccus sp. CSK15P-2]|uniref:GNAT family N-acetyltransferase n=1 Tax=Phycicoccus sp. CSK15P-2 TaxID=2807627 RepID=UPI00194F9FD3|nr:GNAT family N-acetyltransferase [Phycicoccus sp. CSK15P-2]MBM6403786.1 GNAT family N-acetyltransferase [Phycicoccus sp. CSK15P-2]
MGRRPVEVTPVGEDLQVITALWLESRMDEGMRRDICERTIADGRLAKALRRPGVTAFVARFEGTPVGYAITTENPFGLSPTPEVAVEQLFVCAEARRHGVAKALLTAVLGAAERAGCDTVVSNVPTASREANRFFARLGFGSAVTRRVVPTGVLRRRLTPETADTGIELSRRRRNLKQRAFEPSRSA